MANPQIEDGFTKLANELLEVIYKTKFNGTQLRIVMVVLRYTYGFNRKSHDLSLKFIAEAIGANKGLVKREVDRLIDCKVISVLKSANFNKTREIGLNKNYTEWEIENSIENDRQYSNKSTVNQEVDTQYSNRSTDTVPQLEYQEIKVLNKNINKTTSSDEENIKTEDVAKKNENDSKKESDFSTLATLYQKCGFTVNGMTSSWLESILSEYGLEWCKSALLESEKRGKRTKKYAEGILQNWKRDGGIKIEKNDTKGPCKVVKPLKTRFHNFESTYTKYKPDELDGIVRNIKDKKTEDISKLSLEQIKEKFGEDSLTYKLVLKEG